MSNPAPLSGARTPLQRTAGVVGDLFLATLLVTIPPALFGIAVALFERLLALFR